MTKMTDMNDVLIVIFDDFDICEDAIAEYRNYVLDAETALIMDTAESIRVAREA